MDLLFNLKSKPIISEDVIWRYEANINQGTLFLYNINTRKIHEGNHSLYTVLTAIDGEKTLQDIIEQISEQYKTVPKEKIESSILNIFKFFKEKEITI